MFKFISLIYCCVFLLTTPAMGDTIGNSLPTKKTVLAQQIMLGISVHTPTDKVIEILRKIPVGGILWIGKDFPSPKRLKLKNDTIRQHVPYPLWFAIDQEGGPVTRLRQPGVDLLTPNQVGDSNAPMVGFQAGSQMGNLCKMAGIDINFSPVLDIAKQTHPFLGKRVFGATPHAVAQLAIPYISGLKAHHILSTAKHFPGHGSVVEDSHYKSPISSKSKTGILNQDMSPFKAAIKSGVDFIMVSHVKYKYLDSQNIATFSPYIIQGLLRQSLGFDGLIISDDLAMKSVGKPIDIAIVNALGVGHDMVIVVSSYTKFETVFKNALAIFTPTVANYKSISKILQLKKRDKKDE